MPVHLGIVRGDKHGYAVLKMCVLPVISYFIAGCIYSECPEREYGSQTLHTAVLVRVLWYKPGVSDVGVDALPVNFGIGQEIQLLSLSPHLRDAKYLSAGLSPRFFIARVMPTPT